MATITSNASGSWATGATWVGGIKPADGDTVVIASGHNILMNDDLSAYTGLATVTIQGGATPGMLYFMNGTSGYLKIRTANNLVGTTSTNRGRLLANSDGTWGNTGSLAFADKAVILLGATSKIDCTSLDVALYCSQPSHLFVRTYKVKYDFTASSGTVDTSANTIDLGTTPPTANTLVMITSAAGTLPGGLFENVVYYVRGISGNKCKLSLSNSDTSIVDINSAGSGTCTLFTGHTDTATGTINVLDDVTSDAAWITTTGHNRVVLSSFYPVTALDQQRLTLTTINSGNIVLSANVDSIQVPGGRIYLSSRNVSIRSAAVTAVNVFDYVSATTLSGIFQCEIINTAGTGTTYYGTAINCGTNHVVSGTVTGFNAPISNTIGGTFSGTLMAGNYGFSSGAIGGTMSGTIISFNQALGIVTSFTVSGSIIGCTYGFYNVANPTISGIILGCNTGISYVYGAILSGSVVCCNIGISGGLGHTISGQIFGCGSQGMFNNSGSVITGNIFGCVFGIYACNNLILSGRLGYDSFDNVLANTYDFCIGNSTQGILNAIFRGALFPASPSFNQRNAIGSLGKQGVFSEDHGRSLGASYSYLPTGDVIKNTSVTRAGGASSSLEVVPLSACSVLNPIQIFEWTELAVPASSQTKSIYVKGLNWSSFPTNSELYFEAEYISDGTTFARTIIASTQVLTDNTTWTQLSVTFTPAAAGHVRYRAFLKEYASTCKVYVDNELV